VAAVVVEGVVVEGAVFEVVLGVADVVEVSPVLVFEGVEVPFGESLEVPPMGLVPFGETEAAFALRQPPPINDHPLDNKSVVG